MVSATYLIKSVFTIRREYKELTDQQLPIRNLLVHTAAFTLYLVGFVFQDIALILVGIFDGRQWFWTFEYYAADFKLTVGFISELLLILIFKDLASKSNPADLIANKLTESNATFATI